MSVKKYESHIDKPEVHTTSKGGSFVTPFDVIRSKAGRALVKSHTSISAKASNSTTAKKSTSTLDSIKRD